MPEQDTNPPPQEPTSYVSQQNTTGGNHIWQAIKSSKLLKIGLPLLLVALLPVIVLLAQERQENQSRASAASVLYFTPDSSQTSPITASEGDEIHLTIEVDPGSNTLTAIQPTILYDKEILEPAQDLAYNTTAFPQKIFDARFKPGEITFAVGLKPDSTTITTTKTQVAAIRFTVLKKPEDKGLTLVRFGPDTLVTARGESLNVLSSTKPAVISVKENPNFVSTKSRGKIIGEYVDAQGKDFSLPQMQVTLTEQGKSSGTVLKDKPGWQFENLKPGKYRLQVTPITGYDTLISECEKRCKEAKPQYKRDYSIQVNVEREKTVHVSVKYVRNSTALPNQQTDTTSSVQSTPQPVCSPSTADLNKDGRVDNADHTIIANCYKKSPSTPGCSASDIDKNGVIDEIDQNCVLRGGQ